jgi:hypothetical protein
LYEGVRVRDLKIEESESEGLCTNSTALLLPKYHKKDSLLDFHFETADISVIWDSLRILFLHKNCSFRALSAQNMADRWLSAAGIKHLSKEGRMTVHSSSIYRKKFLRF